MLGQDPVVGVHIYVFGIISSKKRKMKEKCFDLNWKKKKRKVHWDSKKKKKKRESLCWFKIKKRKRKEEKGRFMC